MSYSGTMMPIREIPQSFAGEAALLGSIMLEPACLARILDSVPSAANAVYYAKIVKDKQVLRELIQAGCDICDKAYGQCEEPAELLDLLLNSNVAVGMFSLEMGCIALTERMMSSNTRLPLQKVRKGELDFRGFAQLADSVSRFDATNMWIDEVSILMPLSLRARARRLKVAHKLGLIVIDYLQLMSIQEGRRYENRQQEITKISRSIKSLAMELKVPILLLSQLNRAPMSRNNFLPRLTDLRESGGIEQDADMVLLLHREDYYHRGERDYVKTSVADLIVAKQRNGPTGTVKLTFCPEPARFENHAPVLA
ncbi:MAG: DnaB-like helicase C-terminal domain-containing protein [Planctomycetota bacterium]|jgi:replicative DNA helicase